MLEFEDRRLKGEAEKRQKKEEFQISFREVERLTGDVEKELDSEQVGQEEEQVDEKQEDIIKNEDDENQFSLEGVLHEVNECTFEV
jgi:hypothetical protein